MTTSIALLILLLIIRIFEKVVSITNLDCPTECECEKTATEFKEIFTVYCYKGGLNDSHFSQILEKIPSNVGVLEIRAPLSNPNNFQWNDNLNRFTKLRRLSLVNCGIPTLSQSVRLKSLTHLNLQGNRIDHFLMGSFIGLPSLELLDLSHNNINLMPTGAFNFLKSLKSLSLAHNKINDLAMNLLRGPQKLRELELDGNPLEPKQLNEMFSDVEHLEKLEMNFCNLSDEKISKIDFEKLSNLKSLGLAGNNLTNVPSKRIRLLPLLENISLSHNKIRTLEPCAFCGCNISRVFLAHNFLGVDKESIHPEAFADTKMTELDLSFNYLDQFDAGNLGHAQHSLKVFHLSGNSFGNFHYRLTYSLHSLTHLHMAANGLRSVPHNLPYEYTQLKFLNLSGNSLEDLPEDISQLLPSLRVLDMSFNMFSSISPSIFASFVGQLDQVYLNDNPWDCRCATQNLQHYMLQRYSYHVQLNYDRTLCAKPQLLKDQPLHKVHYINDCAVLFGATYGLTQTSELVLLLSALVVTSLLIAFVILILLYCGKDRKYKGTYVTREHSRTRLTHPIDGAFSGTSSAMSEPLTGPSSPMPPAPPPPPGSMFVAF